MLRADQFILAAAHEIEKIVKELADVGRADEIFQAQFADSPPQVHPQILVIEHLERPSAPLQKRIAPGMKRARLQTFDVCALEFRAHPSLHFRGRIVGVGERQNLIGPRVAPPYQVRDALNQDGSFARPRARENHHRPMNMLNGFPLTFVGNNLLRGGNDGGTH